MLDVRFGAGRYFERGIESIDSDAPERFALPESHRLAPAFVARPDSLDALLNVQNLESLLESSALPELVEAWVLAPRRFRAALDAALTSFNKAAKARRAANPALSKQLERAAEVVGEEIELRELLQANLTALVAG